MWFEVEKTRVAHAQTTRPMPARYRSAPCPSEPERCLCLSRLITLRSPRHNYSSQARNAQIEALHELVLGDEISDGKYPQGRQRKCGNATPLDDRVH
jgi:hypothetical protein